MKHSKSWLILILLAFSLHFVWEKSHLPLYYGYQNLSPFLPITIWATVGDVLYTLVVVGIATLFKKDFGWIKNIGRKDIIGLAIAGFFVALFVEYKAFAFNLWFYSSEMPIIPIIRVGLSPVLQMTILLPLSVYITNKLSLVF